MRFADSTSGARPELKRAHVHKKGGAVDQMDRQVLDCACVLEMPCPPCDLLTATRLLFVRLRKFAR